MNITRGPLGTSGGEKRAAMYLLPCRKLDQERQKPPVKDLVYDDQQRMLRGISCTVAGDPSQLRIYVPDGFSAKRAELSNVRAPTLKTHGNLLTVDYMSSTGKDVEWKVFFQDSECTAHGGVERGRLYLMGLSISTISSGILNHNKNLSIKPVTLSSG